MAITATVLNRERIRVLCVKKINATPPGRARVDLMDRATTILDYLHTREMREILKRAGGFCGLKPAILGKDI